MALVPHDDLPTNLVPTGDLPANLVPAHDMPSHLAPHTDSKPGGGGAFDAQGNPVANYIVTPQEEAERKAKEALPWDVPMDSRTLLKSNEMVRKADEALPLVTKEPGLQHLLSGILSSPIVFGEQARGIRPQPAPGTESLATASMALGGPAVARSSARAIDAATEAALKPPTAGMGPPPAATMTKEAAGKIATSVSENAEAKFGTNARPEIVKAHQAGYVFPPAEIPPMEGRLPVKDSLLSGEGGKIKLQQLASTRNQGTTNRLAAGSIGLPPEMPLNEQAFARAKQAPAAVYEEVRNAIPEVSLASDPVYAKDAANIGGRNSLVEKYFPEMKENPGILALRETMARNQTVPTDVAMKAIADLRSQATQNFKAIGDSAAQKHALALAQKEAANIMEQAVERSVQDVPGYFKKKLDQAIAKRAEIDADIRTAQPSAGQRIDPVSPHQRMLEDLRNKRVAAEQEVASLRERLEAASSNNDTNQSLVSRFRDARKMFAKIYTLEDATNTTTGNVSARGLGRLTDKGGFLSDELKSIADAYHAAPKAMQNPEMFGRAEDWSALDFFGTTMAAMHGNVPAAVGILSRPLVRRHQLSPGYQRRLIGNQPVPELPEVARTAAALGGP